MPQRAISAGVEAELASLVATYGWGAKRIRNYWFTDSGEPSQAWEDVKRRRLLQPDETPPSVSAIQTRLPGIRRKSAEELRSLRFVRWPSTFDDGDLPWEAAPFVVEVVREMPGIHMPVKLAHWYWRIRTSAPDLSVYHAWSCAVHMAAAPAQAGPSVERIIFTGTFEPIGTTAEDSQFFEDLRSSMVKGTSSGKA